MLDHGSIHATFYESAISRFIAVADDPTETAVEQRLSRLEAKISLVLWVAGFALPALAAALLGIYWFLNGISEKIGKLDARAQGYENEALLKIFSQVRTADAKSPAGQEVKAAIEKVAQDTIQHEQEKKPVSSSVYYELGMFAATNGNPRQAAEYFEKAVATNPIDFRAWSSASAAYIEIADRELGNQQDLATKARSAAEKALGINPNHPKAYNNLGVALFLLGDKRSAVGAERKAIDLDPKSAAPYYNLACFYAKDRWDTKKALAYLELAVERGYDKLKQLRADERKCFSSIRNSNRFRELKTIVAKRARGPLLP